MKKAIMSLGLVLLVTSCELKVNTKPTEKENKEMKQNIPFPLETKFTKEYLVANFWKCNYSTAGEGFAYWVILPNNVKPTKLEPELMKEVGLTNIGIYNTIDKSAYIEVWVAYETITTPTQPMDWLTHKIKITGETILHQNIINTTSGNKYLDVLTSKTIANGENVISRFTVLKSSSNYFIIKATCNEKDYISLSETLLHIVSTWGLKK